MTLANAPKPNTVTSEPPDPERLSVEDSVYLTPSGQHDDGCAQLRHILIVTGLSGAGKSTTLRVLEDLGHEVVDNPPLHLLGALVPRPGERLVIGLDVRSRGFETARVLLELERLKAVPDNQVQLVYVTAEPDVLLRRFTATRRRHPLVASGAIRPGIEQEARILAPLRAVADTVIDTSDLPAPELKRFIETRFGDGSGEGLTVVLMSFAYPAGLPREADMVFDARFLRNPHYNPALQPRTGLEEDVAAYVRTDKAYAPFFDGIMNLLELVLPRFVEEGKKYATIAVGCSGGKHRSVTIVEALARVLPQVSPVGPFMVTHRELARQGVATWRWAVPPVSAVDGTAS
ncbi:RNase adapter RapZ [Neokomagataea thailandica]|uniref:ATPase n=1 Tax=Neokomagataea tanensis NBRC 106556 TaxID=1223519 RepID=A0ABQ0QFY0_9PROT|nr:MULTISPECIES: RNase adapter RapZ [Neokomagataea]GBR43299.1 ATPase [Neokomagataea tanensis NBRC 106556]